MLLFFVEEPELINSEHYIKFSYIKLKNYTPAHDFISIA